MLSYMHKMEEVKLAEFDRSKIKIVVFDVDDTVTRGTLGIKIAVWEDLFKDEAEKLREAREIYEATGRGDRYNIIAHIIGESQENCRENPKVVVWANRFENESMTRIRQNGIHTDDLNALAAIRSKLQGPRYLLSATPQMVVENNVHYFESQYPEIKGMFSGVIGTPMDGGKAGELKKLIAEYGVEPHEVLMVGDGGSDYRGASGAKTQFVAVIPEGKPDPWPKELFPKIKSIAELPNLLGLD